MSIMGGRHAPKGQLNGFPQNLGAHQALKLILSNPDFPEPKPSAVFQATVPIEVRSSAKLHIRKVPTWCRPVSSVQCPQGV
jgi:hypothetical protein